MARDITLNDVFLHEKPVKMLTALTKNDKNYASTLAKAADCTYSHTVKILDLFKKAGLVEFNKKGRVKFITLTAKGNEIAKNFDDMFKNCAKIKLKV